MSFHNITLPKFIWPYLVASPYYSTSIARTNSGREIRSADNANQQTKYILHGCNLSRNQFEEFNSFFRARMGQKFSFLLKDPAESFLEKQQVDFVLDQGEVKISDIYKYYHDTIMPARKLIKHVITPSLRIWIDDVEYKGDRLVNTQGVSFRANLNANNNIFISTEYLTEVRFAHDSFEYKQADNGTIALSDIEMIEIGGVLTRL